jgi:hypothetical protein
LPASHLLDHPWLLVASVLILLQEIEQPPDSQSLVAKQGPALAWAEDPDEKRRSLQKKREDSQRIASAVFQIQPFF